MVALLFIVPPEVGERVQPGERADSLCVNRSDICQAIKAAAVANGDKAASYSSHSGRIGGATLLLQAGVSVNTIKLAGRWKGDTWSIYSRMTSTAMYGVAADMIGTSTKKQVNADNALMSESDERASFSDEDIKLLGSNKSNYGSGYRVMSIPWILVLYKKRKRIAEADSFLLFVTHPTSLFVR